MFTKQFMAALMIVGVLLAAGCSDDDSSPNRSGTAGIDGANLIGLASDRVLTFLQTDTITDSSLSVSIAVSQRSLTVTGSGSDWIINDGDNPVANLKLNDESITLNGYWRTDQGTPSLSYFAVPPVMMPRDLSNGDVWSGYTPEINLGSGNEPFTFAFCYFGFFFTKEYVGRQLIQLPAGSFEAYRFDVQLFRNYADALPAAEIQEYYDPAVGLVQLNFRGGPTNRTLSLINSQ